MTKKALTALAVTRLSPPIAGRVEIADAAVPGLVLRVTDRGVKSWSVLYRVYGEGGPAQSGLLRKGPQRRFTIGQFPAWDLLKAREKACEVIRVASEGRDPAAARRTQSAQLLVAAEPAVDGKTFEWAIDTFAKTDSTETAEHRKRQLQLHVVPLWGDRALAAISRPDMHTLLDDLKTQKGADAARRARKHLTALFNWAVDRGHLAENPAAGLKRQDLKYIPRERTLSDAEVRAIWAAADTLGYPFGPIYKLLLLTGQRLEEIAAAHRSWLDATRAVIEIPAEHYKSRRPHVVPLGTAAAAIVEALPNFGPRTFLFSTCGGKAPVAGYSNAKQRLDRKVLELQRSGDPSAEPLPHWVVHDFRRTVKTGLAALRVEREIRDRVMGHAKEGMDKTYDKHDYLDEKREALERWAHRLMVTVR